MKIFAWLKKTVIFSGLFLTFGLFSTSAFAIDLHSFFTIAKHDVSFGMLQTIFGQVGNLFPKGNPAILNSMFQTINLAMLVLLTFVVVYVVVISVINTAHQGEFLGKKLDSMWVPARVIMAIMLVSPLPCGYSAIQVIMMWVVLQGVGAADCLWHNVVKYVSSSNGPTAANALMSSGQFSPETMTKSKHLLEALTYIHVEYKSIHHSKNIQDDNLMPTLKYCSYCDEKLRPCKEYRIGIVVPKDPQHPHGPQWYDSGIFYWPEPSSINSTKDQILATAVDKGMINMVVTLNETAKKIAYGKFDSNPSGEVNEQNPLAVTLFYFQRQMLDAQKEISQQQGGEIKSDFWKNAADEGWMSAGMYYYDIAQQNNKTSSIVTNPFASIMTKRQYGRVYLNIIDKKLGKTIDEIYDDAFEIPVVRASDLSTSLKSHNLTGKLVTPILRAITLQNLDSGDPLLVLQALGNIILTSATVAWASFITVMTATAAAISVGSYLLPAISSVYHVVMLVFMPFIMVLAVFFTTSITLSFYIPMIPYIIFTFAAIGWMIAVFETMLAAPIVAIGLADPHGQHEVLGRAEPALQMLANVFLRPSLMIFGLIGGMILAKAAVGLINKTFFYLTFKIISTSASNAGAYISMLKQFSVSQITSVNVQMAVAGMFTGAWYAGTAAVEIVGFIMLLCMYVLILMSVVNRCFSLIHMFPDRILSWLGWQAQFGQYSQAPEQELKQGFKTASDGATKLGQQGLDGAKKTQDSMVQYGSNRGRLANDWGHNKSASHFAGAKSMSNKAKTGKAK